MKEKVFSIFINDRSHNLTRENTIVYLYREHQDMDHLVILEGEEAANIYRLPDLCRYMAGLAFKASGAPYVPKNSNRRTFEDEHGWFADIYIQDKASDEVIEAYARLDAAHDINDDGTWQWPEEEDE